MSEAKPFFSKEIVTARSDLLPTLMEGLPFGLAAILAGLILTIGINALVGDDADRMYELRQSILKDAVRDGEVGMIRPPERWSDHDRVSYRWWEADTVVVVRASTSEGWLHAGDRCHVHGSTTVTFASMFDGDALAIVGPRAEPRAVYEFGDCPNGTAFVVNLDEADRMLWNMRQRKLRHERDRALLGLAD